jgi:hypothetical protein
VSERTLEEFLSVVAHAIGAESAVVLDPADEAVVTLGETPADDTTVRCDLPGGRRLVARLAAPAPDLPALQRRLELLAETFADLFPRDQRARASRPPPARTLREELAALVHRAGASDALIIDAHSPVVWGSAGDAPEPEPVSVETPLPPPVSITPATMGDPQRVPQTPPPPSVAPPSAGETPRPPAALHAVGPEDVAAVQYGLASAQGVRVDPVAMGVVPRAVCARHRVLPIARDGERLVLAMADPRDAEAIHDVVLTTGLDVDPVYAGDSMAAFFQHLDDGGDTRTYDEVMAAIPPEVRAVRGDRARAARDEWARTLRARRAIADVRTLPEMASLHRGGHLRHTAEEPGFGYVARSFAAIYVLVLVYENPIEELTAKRAINQALPTIERLVAALPPLDPPPPTAGAAAMRGGRRRR